MLNQVFEAARDLCAHLILLLLGHERQITLKPLLFLARQFDGFGVPKLE
jgi:hypothetical protein